MDLGRSKAVNPLNTCSVSGIAAAAESKYARAQQEERDGRRKRADAADLVNQKIAAYLAEDEAATGKTAPYGFASRVAFYQRPKTSTNQDESVEETRLRLEIESHDLKHHWRKAKLQQAALAHEQANIRIPLGLPTPPGNPGLRQVPKSLSLTHPPLRKPIKGTNAKNSPLAKSRIVKKRASPVSTSHNEIRLFGSNLRDDLQRDIHIAVADNKLQEESLKRSKKNKRKGTQKNPDEGSDSEYFRACFHFSPAAVGDLELCVGTVLRVLAKDRSEDGWWFGTDLVTGTKGMFPSNFVKPLSERAMDDTQKSPESPSKAAASMFMEEVQAYSQVRECLPLQVSLTLPVAESEMDGAARRIQDSLRKRNSRKQKEKEMLEQQQAASLIQKSLRRKQQEKHLREQDRAARLIQKSIRRKSMNRKHQVREREENDAAALIQASIRKKAKGRKMRQEWEEQDKAARLIQRTHRLRSVEKTNATVVAKQLEEEHQAARLIQSSIRKKINKESTQHADGGNAQVVKKGTEESRAETKSSSSVDSMQINEVTTAEVEHQAARLIQSSIRKKINKESTQHADGGNAQVVKQGTEELRAETKSSSSVDSMQEHEATTAEVEHQAARLIQSSVRKKMSKESTQHADGGNVQVVKVVKQGPEESRIEKTKSSSSVDSTQINEAMTAEVVKNFMLISQISQQVTTEVIANALEMFRVVKVKTSILNGCTESSKNESSGVQSIRLYELRDMLKCSRTNYVRAGLRALLSLHEESLRTQELNDLIPGQNTVHDGCNNLYYPLVLLPTVAHICKREVERAFASSKLDERRRSILADAICILSSMFLLERNQHVQQVTLEPIHSLLNRENSERIFGAKILEDAVWCLGNVAAACQVDDTPHRPSLGTQSLLDTLFKNITRLSSELDAIIHGKKISGSHKVDKRREVLRIAQTSLWTLSNIFRGSHVNREDSALHAFQEIIQLLRTFTSLTNWDDVAFEEKRILQCCLAETIWCIAFQTQTLHEKPILQDQVITSGLSGLLQIILTRFAGSENIKLLLGTLRSLGNLASVANEAILFPVGPKTQVVMAVRQCLEALSAVAIANQQSTLLSKEILWVVSNILSSEVCTRGDPEMSQMLLDSNVLLSLMAAALLCDIPRVQIEACWCVGNLVRIISPIQVHELVSDRIPLESTVLIMLEDLRTGVDCSLCVSLLENIVEKIAQLKHEEVTLPLDVYVLRLHEISVLRDSQGLQSRLHDISALIMKIKTRSS